MLLHGEFPDAAVCISVVNQLESCLSGYFNLYSYLCNSGTQGEGINPALLRLADPGTEPGL